MITVANRELHLQLIVRVRNGAIGFGGHRPNCRRPIWNQDQPLPKVLPWLEHRDNPLIGLFRVLLGCPHQGLLPGQIGL